MTTYCGMCGEEKLLNHDCWGTLKQHLDNIPKMMKEADDKLKTEGVKYDQGKPSVSMVIKEAVKYDKGKPDLSLLPYEALEEISRALMFGAEKYGRYNWKDSMEYSRLISAALRHIYQFNSKEDNDPESGLNHLAHATCNLMFLIYYIKHGIKDKDNR